MTSLVVFTVANGRKHFGAVTAVIWLLTSMSPHMHEEVPFLGENLTATIFIAHEHVVA